MLDPEYRLILEANPFLTFLTYGGNDYIGVVQNSDEFITTIYDFAALRTAEQKTRFIALAEQWWWESNRLIPINVFLKQDWVEFRVCLKTFNSKDVVIQYGPYISLREISQKRGKKRSITLVRKV